MNFFHLFSSKLMRMDMLLFCQNINCMKYVFLAWILTLTLSQTSGPFIAVANRQMLPNYDDPIIYQNGELSSQYSDTVFEASLICRNGNLNIINTTNGNKIIIEYQNIPILQFKDVKISSSPNNQPLPFIQSVNQTHFTVVFNCSCAVNGVDCQNSNYFNKVKINIRQEFQFSFLLNCDPNTRHKQFEYGYLIIALINAFIIIGVAMYSHIWSIRINLRPLRVDLQWKAFLLFSLGGVFVFLILNFLTYKDYQIAFQIIKYVGIALSSLFVWLCFNECFFLMKRLRKAVLRRPIYARWCDILSLICTVPIITVACCFQNWILFDMIACCVCVGSIKIFHFKSLKECFLAMIIMVVTVAILTIALHFILPLSYNDYMGELSSPFFLQVPDFINNLYKKCSWLSVLDVIIPGVTLSYLRVYDQNKSSHCGGIYTISGNLTFVISTVLWIVIELVFPFSVPFSLITFSLLMLVIFIISWRRNDWLTLLSGQFEQGYDIIDSKCLQQHRLSFSKMVSEEALNETMIKDDEGTSIIFTQ